MPANYKSVFSSHIDEIGYDDETREFVVRWSDGNTTIYRGVPIETAHQVWSAPSIGAALHRHMKQKFDFVTRRGKPGNTVGGASR